MNVHPDREFDEAVRNAMLEMVKTAPSMRLVRLEHLGERADRDRDSKLRMNRESGFGTRGRKQPS